MGWSFLHTARHSSEGARAKGAWGNLDMGHTNFIPTTYQRHGVTMIVIDSNVYWARKRGNSNARPKYASCMNHIWAIALFGQARYTPTRFAEYQTARSFFTYGWSLLLTVVFVTYSWSSVLSFLLTVEIWFGRFAHGGKSVWSFLLTVPPRPEIGFGIFSYSSPTATKKDEPWYKTTSTVSKKTGAFGKGVLDKAFHVEVPGGIPFEFCILKGTYLGT